MNNKRLAVILTMITGLLGGAMASYFFGHGYRDANAGRNASGTFSLLPGNPVQTKTIISSSTFNNTESDVAQGLTDSLDRNGRGGMNAALALINGTAANPALTWTSQTNTGWYRAAASDIRISINGADNHRLTTTGFTGIGANGIGVTSTGTGTAAGVSGTGGATSGSGLSGTGGAPNGPGSTETGTGTGVGLLATGGASGGAGVLTTGGATSGAGISATGGTPNGNGGVFTGVGTGNGVRGTGGATNASGVVGIGGGGNSIGVQGTGTGTGVNGTGGYFIGGAGATSVSTAAIRSQGWIDVGSGVGAYASNAGFTNAVTWVNLVKVWALITTDGAGGCTISDGFNVNGCSVAVGGNITVTFATNFSNATYTIFMTPSQAGPKVPYVLSTAVGSMVFQVFTLAGAQTTCDTLACTISYAVIGRQ